VNTSAVPAAMLVAAVLRPCLCWSHGVSCSKCTVCAYSPSERDVQTEQ
jgi:hypothetical protein